MFRAVQFIVRNKFVFIGAAVAVFLVFGRGGEPPKAVNPWGTDSVQQAAVAANESMSDKAVGAVASAAKDYAGVDVGKVLPGNLRKTTVDNWQQTGEAARKANGN
jgi:hypothetical protein